MTGRARASAPARRQEHVKCAVVGAHQRGALQCRRKGKKESLGKEAQLRSDDRRGGDRPKECETDTVGQG